jgi:CheY-like chemotaxis protein
VSVNVIVSDVEKMLKRVIGENIELNVSLAHDLGLVKVDPGQIEQVIVNLAINAKDAMPQGGSLFLETANVTLDEEYARIHAEILPGQYVMLAITDSGIGMDEKVKEKIFDPFFTTKDKGKGTGLGLSTVYGIVKQSGGDIFVYSEPNKGSTFRVYLPRVFKVEEEMPQEKRLEQIPRGSETILVVEDDGRVRKMAVEILKRQGYRVLEADSGEEALAIGEKEKGPIDLILTDIVMPNMDGTQFIERLNQVRKNFIVLYMTGYADNTIIQVIVDQGFDLIQKPFTVEKLAGKIREVLDRKIKS